MYRLRPVSEKEISPERWIAISAGQTLVWRPVRVVPRFDPYSSSNSPYTSCWSDPQSQTSDYLVSPERFESDRRIIVDGR